MVNSTRSNAQVFLSTAILNGLSKDGGLYVFPNLGKIDVNSMLNKNYNDIAVMVFRFLLEDYSKRQIEEIVRSTYNNTYFDPSPVTIKTFGDHAYLNLYHGHTFAFKDMALSILPKLVDASKELNGVTKPNLVLTATSGDTGGAALAGFSINKENKAIVLYPTEGVSEFQELHMNSYQSKNLKIFAVEGNFDDCQNIVKELFMSIKLQNLSLTSANSINIGRLIPQIVYYFYSYVKLVRDCSISYGDKINFCVPTGNFGNIYAGYLAKQMGLPINKLIIASNQNDVLENLFNKGKYNIERQLKKTISPSMDIIISSNFERYLYDIVDKNASIVNNYMEDLKHHKEIVIKELTKQDTFVAGMATEQETKKMIQTTLEKDNWLIDPHTAVARCVYEKSKDDLFTVIVSTANPYKFTDAMLESLQMYKPKSLLAKFNLLEEISKMKIDKRMLKIIESKPNKITLKKEDALEFIKREIGDMDEA